jgi:quercetin dioxygenase-like cupin family protein
MRKFPDFIRSEKNRVPEAPEGMEGYVFDGADGSQIVLWENETGGSVGLHTHDFWEYCLVLDGYYEGIIDGKPVRLGPGDELVIPPGVPHEGKHSANYRAIDIFSGQRIKR